MAIPKWAANTLYQPGAFVLPKSTSQVFKPQPNNPGFEDGLTHWDITYLHHTSGVQVVAASTDEAFDGTTSAYWVGDGGNGFKSSVTAQLVNDFEAPVTPGQKITATGYIWRNTTPSATSACDGSVGILWSDASHAQIGAVLISKQPGGTSAGGWTKRSVLGTAPVGAAFAQFVVQLVGNTSGAKIYADACSWDYAHQGVLPGFVFVAVQTAAGLSGKSEPVWPDELGYTIVDNAVTWEAEDASRVIWTAIPILESGASQPTFPTTVGSHVIDGTIPSQISWVTVDGRIQDPNCPNTKQVAIGASKIYAANGDTIAFSATTNPLDWSTQFDAGFLPFGLQTYGNEPVSALGLYRSNLLAFNSIGYQMWQIDADPANMAFLDGSPVGNPFFRSGAPVNNDFVYLTSVGIRSIGIAGASTNLQAGSFGKQVDPIVKALIAAGIDPQALFFPGTGQYWLIFGNEAIVLTMNGGAADQSFSRYVFPADIDNWTVLDGVLFLRAGDLVWQVDENTLIDDAHTAAGTLTLTATSGTFSVGAVTEGSMVPGDIIVSAHLPANAVLQPYGSGGSTGRGGTGSYQVNKAATETVEETFTITGGGTPFDGYMSWPYLDFGNIGLEKQLEGFGLVCTGDCTVSVGYDQNDFSLATEEYTVFGDTLEGVGMIPHPISAKSMQFRLDFGTGQDWEWNALVVYNNTLGQT